MTTLTIRADELIMAFEDNSPGYRYFFDTQTGEVVPLFDDIDDGEDAGKIEADPGRYVEIEPISPRRGFDIMLDFLETRPEGKILDELSRALDKKRPFRRFKDVLQRYPEVEADWFRFHEQALMAMIQEWLEGNGIAATLIPFHGGMAPI